MSVRVLLAVVLAAALVATAAPAVDTARIARAEHAGDATLDDLAAAVAELQHTEPAPSVDLAARRVVRVRLPPGAAGTEPVLSVGEGFRESIADGPRSDVFAYRVAGRTRLRRVHVDVRVRRPSGGRSTSRLSSDDQGLRVEDGTTLVLSYVERDGRPTILVREFIPEDGTNPGHAA